MDSVVELTYHQLLNRLRLLISKYTHFILCTNCSNQYSPVEVLCRARFNFDDTTYLCYKNVLNGEKHHTINCCTEVFNLELVSEEYINQNVLVVSNTNKTYSICGVYVDEDNQRLVLLNGYHDGKPVDWSHLGGDIY